MERDRPTLENRADLQYSGQTPWPDFATAPAIECGDDRREKPALSEFDLEASEKLARKYFDRGIRI